MINMMLFELINQFF